MATVTQASTALKVDAATVNYEIRAQPLDAAVREGIAAADVGTHPVVEDLADGEVAMDRRWIIEAVRQLVDNAAKFSPPDSPIHVAARIDDGVATIEVVDRGPGSRSSAVTTSSTSIRTGAPTATSKRRARGWGSSSSAASSRAIRARLASSTSPVGVRCSASGFPWTRWRTRWPTDRDP